MYGVKGKHLRVGRCESGDHLLASGLEISGWRHQMETFSALLALWAGNSAVTGKFPAQRPLTRSFYVFFDLAWLNAWVNNREAGDLRRHHAHYDVILMLRLIPASDLPPCTHSPLPPTAPHPDLRHLQRLLQAREVMKPRHVTSVGKLKCFSLQLGLVQQRNFRLQITIAR